MGGSWCLLTGLRADSLIMYGTTASGCVRATVIGAFSLSYTVSAVIEATFGRGGASHWISQFGMDRTYADVVPLAEVLEHLGPVQAGLPDARFPALAAAG